VVLAPAQERGGLAAGTGWRVAGSGGRVAGRGWRAKAGWGPAAGGRAGCGVGRRPHAPREPASMSST
ncbi:hypothetical protein ACLQ2M_41490, partial [Streptomyces sp. DT7]